MITLNFKGETITTENIPACQSRSEIFNGYIR